MTTRALLGWLWYLGLCIMAVLAADPARLAGPCRIKCGVVTTDEESGGGSAWADLVQTAWADLASRKGLSDVEITFVTVHRRTEFTMDMLIEAYMEIGTTNISAMIGPYVVPLATATEKFGIPYFVTTALQHSFYRPYNMISVSPDPVDLLVLTTELARRYHWPELAVLYDTQEGARLIERLVLLNTIRVRSWKLGSNATKMDVQQTLLALRNLDVLNIVLFVSRPLAVRVLDGALYLSMLSRDFCWILPNLNLDSSDLKPYLYSQVNFTTLKLVQEAFSESHLLPAAFSQLDYATTLDSLLTLYHGVKTHFRRRRSCHWNGQDQILRILPKIEDTGATGRLTFREDGTRQGYIIDILGLAFTQLTKVGYWNSSETDSSRRLVLNMSSLPARAEETAVSPTPAQDDILKVAMVLRPPYIQLSKDHYRQSGNQRYDGFCVELLRHLCAILGLRYHLYLVPDDSLGTRRPSGIWTGAVGQLVQGNASMVLGPLLITSVREEAIDFTKPFKMVGLSLVGRRPGSHETLFQFLAPLSTPLWVVLLGLLVLLSIALYVVDRVAPPDGTPARLSAQNCVWFTCSSLVLRTVDIQPRTVSGRILAGALWIFSLLIVAAYTANFAALLTTSRVYLPIRSITDLVGQNKIKYGTVQNTHVSAFFETSKVNPFRAIWQVWTKLDPDGLLKNASQGFERVRSSEGRFVFIWDSSEVRQKVSEDCELVELGQPIYFRSYGLGLPHGSPHRDRLNTALLQLAEDGRLTEIEKRWWPDSLCPEADAASLAARSLPIEKMAGLFILLGLVMALALLIAVAEYYIRFRRRKRATLNRAARAPMIDQSLVTSQYKMTPAVWENATGGGEEKVAEESVSTKPLCDGSPPAPPAPPAAEEAFLASPTFRASKQTNIF